MSTTETRKRAHSPDVSLAPVDAAAVVTTVPTMDDEQKPIKDATADKDDDIDGKPSAAKKAKTLADELACEEEEEEARCKEGSLFVTIQQDAWTMDVQRNLVLLSKSRVLRQLLISAQQDSAFLPGSKPHLVLASGICKDQMEFQFFFGCYIYGMAPYTNQNSGISGTRLLRILNHLGCVAKFNEALTYLYCRVSLTELYEFSVDFPHVPGVREKLAEKCISTPLTEARPVGLYEHIGDLLMLKAQRLTRIHTFMTRLRKRYKEVTDRKCPKKFTRCRLRDFSPNAVEATLDLIESITTSTNTNVVAEMEEQKKDWSAQMPFYYKSTMPAAAASGDSGDSGDSSDSE